MTKNWKIVYSTNEIHIAELAKRLLEDNDIQAVILNQQDLNYHVGSIEVMVERDSVIRAKNLLNKNSFE
ncbi:MAG: DUF2007 domain-containing protein [Bacteroidales bacterium]|nr:DUF2007 domain-containing protein [Bacteroidales bacterium]